MYDIKNAEDINLGKHGKTKGSGIKALDDYTLKLILLNLFHILNKC